MIGVFLFNKVAFTRKFCQKYQEIGKLLTLCPTLEEVEQLSSSIVHISVQLFSNQTLVAKMVQEQNLLHVMVKVLLEMMRTTLQPMKVNGKFMPTSQYYYHYINITFCNEDLIVA